MFKRIFTDHPQTVGETYGEHFVQAVSFAGALLRASTACLIHGLIPCFFEKTASSAVSALHERMVVKRAEQTPGRKLRAARDGA